VNLARCRALTTPMVKLFDGRHPSIEGYAYKMVQGELVIQVLFTVQEQDSSLAVR
jgi:hypothetical protein